MVDISMQALAKSHKDKKISYAKKFYGFTKSDEEPDWCKMRWQ